MPSAEGVRESFDALENELAHEGDHIYELVTSHGILTATRYQVAAYREIAVQLARVADALEKRSPAQSCRS